MNFELKNAVPVGDVQSEDASNSLQWLNISVGVVGNPHTNMIETTTVKYVFANTLTVQQAKDGVQIFAESWVATNYPSV